MTVSETGDVLPVIQPNPPTREIPNSPVLHRTTNSFAPEVLKTTDALLEEIVVGIVT